MIGHRFSQGQTNGQSNQEGEIKVMTIQNMVTKENHFGNASQNVLSFFHKAEWVPLIKSVALDFKKLTVFYFPCKAFCLLGSYLVKVHHLLPGFFSHFQQICKGLQQWAGNIQVFYSDMYFERDLFFILLIHNLFIWSIGCVRKAIDLQNRLHAAHTNWLLLPNRKDFLNATAWCRRACWAEKQIQLSD